ncbi:MAG: alanine racemase [Pseudomonadota bacterium]
MARAELTIDLDAIAANWRALDAMTTVETAAVIKADAYGLGAARVGPTLVRAGAKTFFVALAEEGAVLREAIGPTPRIFVFSGLMTGDERVVRYCDLIPLLNSTDQVARARKVAAETDTPLTCGLQVDSGMNRLGLEQADLNRLLQDDQALNGIDLALVMSHLACADQPDHHMNRSQKTTFDEMIALPALAGLPHSLAATGGVLLGSGYHYGLTRPGIGLYGGLPFANARPVVSLKVPIIQIRNVAPGEVVGYGAAFETSKPRRIATISAGYADGLIRHLTSGFAATINGKPAPSAGRVSMDLITLDVTDVPDAAEGMMATLLGPSLGIDQLAASASTIGYEILTSLGARYDRRYTGG